jgi:hypothetical protein
MEFRLAIAAVCAAVLVCAAPAHAATYNWSYSSSTHSGSGQLTASDSGPPYTITAINGVFDSWSVVGLANTCCGSPPASQLLYSYSAELPLDNLGMAFSTDATDGINIFYMNQGYVMQDTDQDYVEGGSFTLTLVPGPQPPVPEPATFALFAIGLAALVAGRRWRKSIPKPGVA